ncbi:MAG: carbohydrate-binding domain-containing protein [Clostridia bacterium]|nr:carbohydrate-binding domain-containing protein [Clostridia bacterium]
MKKKFVLTISLLCVSVVFFFSACSGNFFGDREKFNSAVDSGIDTDAGRPDDENQDMDINVDETKHDYVCTDIDVQSKSTTYTFLNEDEDVEEFVVEYSKGLVDCLSFNEESNILTISDADDDSEFTLSGSFHGSVIVDATKDGEDVDVTLNLSGLILTSYDLCPINFVSGDDVSISAKNGTVNYIYDLRDEVGEDDEDKQASVYSATDLKLKGKGELYIKSVNNNGIHSKDDLSVQNLTLFVDCVDNALKGNDSVTVDSGDITLIARKGDTIKTSKSDVSSKGIQKGSIEIYGGDLLLYAASDGMDAAYDVIIGKEDDEDFPSIEIYTDKYSKYSEEITATEEGKYYIQCSSTDYKYSIKYFNDDDDIVWKNSSDCIEKTSGGRRYYYYPIEKPEGYANLQVFVYTEDQKQGQENDYFTTMTMTPNASYDTIHFSVSQGYAFSWTNYSTTEVQGGRFGPGSQQSASSGGSDYSTKGIKADNKVEIYGCALFVSSYDDAIHANSDVVLENGVSPDGGVYIHDGDIELYTNDDGVHADIDLCVEGGTILIGSSYEGLEGKTVFIGGGDISVTSSDDGVNGTSTSGIGIEISGGNLYVYAGGDGLDSNSRSSYQGIVISGGKSVIISVGNADSSIDNENGYKYEGGYILGVSVSGGMSKESKKCNEFSTNGTEKTMSLSEGAYIEVDGYVTVRMPVKLSAYVVFLCDKNNVSISSKNSSDRAFDSNGVCWTV